MENLTKTLLNLRSLRAFSRENLTLEQLEDALDKFTIIVKERQLQAEHEQQLEQEKQQKLAAIAKQVEEQGIDINALAKAIKAIQSPKANPS